jgi:hypothetical protein
VVLKKGNTGPYHFEVHYPGENSIEAVDFSPNVTPRSSPMSSAKGSARKRASLAGGGGSASSISKVGPREWRLVI